jgi:hypothetical protein
LVTDGHAEFIKPDGTPSAALLEQGLDTHRDRMSDDFDINGGAYVNDSSYHSCAAGGGCIANLAL